MIRTATAPPRKLTLAVIGHSELAVRDLYAMLQPHAEQESLALRRAGGSAPLTDIILYET